MSNSPSQKLDAVMALVSAEAATLGQKIDDVTEVQHLVIDGLKLNTAAIGHVGDTAAKILEAVTDRDEGESPLMAALNDIIGLLDRHARSLDRIEDRLTRLERRQAGQS